MTYTETSKRQRENKATSLFFFSKALQRMPAEFLGLFFKESYVCTHMHTYTYTLYTHTHSLILGPAYPSGADIRVDVYT